MKGQTELMAVLGVGRPGSPLLEPSPNQLVGTRQCQVTCGCPCPVPVAWQAATFCRTIWECSPDRLIDAFLRSSCFLPWYSAPERPGVPSSFYQGVPRLRSLTYPQLSSAGGLGASCSPGFKRLPKPSVGSASEAGFLGPHPTSLHQQVQERAFLLASSEPWCLKPALWP